MRGTEWTWEWPEVKEEEEKEKDKENAKMWRTVAKVVIIVDSVYIHKYGWRGGNVCRECTEVQEIARGLNKLIQSELLCVSFTAAAGEQQ